MYISNTASITNSHQNLIRTAWEVAEQKQQRQTRDYHLMLYRNCKHRRDAYLSGKQVESLLAQDSLPTELIVGAEAGGVGAAGGRAGLVLLLLTNIT